MGTGASALVPGFFIGGDGPKPLLIRAVGPGLAQFGVTGLLADPEISLIPAGKDAVIASNDNWGGGGLLADAFAAAGAFPLLADDKDGALVVRLPPGGYTVIVSGVGGTTGSRFTLCRNGTIFAGLESRQIAIRWGVGPSP